MPVTVTSIGTATSTSGATSLITIGAGGVGAGNLIVVAVTEKSTSGTSGTLLDSASNTWTVAQATNLNGASASGRGTVFYAWNNLGLSNGHTIRYTKNLSGAVSAMSALVATGVQNNADPLDTTTRASATGSTGTITVTSGTPTVDGELIIGVLCDSGTTTTGGNTSFTQAGGYTTPPVEATTSGSGNARVDGGWRRQGVRAVDHYSPTMGSTAQVWADIILGFKTTPDPLFNKKVYELPPQDEIRGFWRIDEFYSFFRDMPIVPQFKPPGQQWTYPPRVTWYQDWNKRFQLTPVVVATLPNNQDDWPVPPRVIWYREWTQRFDLRTLGTPPFNQDDWPNPQPVSWARDWNQNIILLFPPVSAKPFHINEWPLPQRLQWYQDWSQSLLETPFFKPIPYQEYNWPVPQRVIWSPETKWIPYVPQTLPFSQRDWPNPRTVTWYQDWEQGPKVPQTRPFNQSDWPNPRGVDWRRDWYNTVYYPFAVIPTNQKDWPNPTPVKWYQDWIQTLPEAVRTPPGKPFHINEWPIPYPVYWFRDYNQNIILLFPPPTPSVSQAVYAKEFFKTEGSFMGMPGKGEPTS